MDLTKTLNDMILNEEDAPYQSKVDFKPLAVKTLRELADRIERGEEIVIRGDRKCYGGGPDGLKGYTIITKVL
ncbi:hypothetical protein OU748_001074 [Yersinia enterocolitica]|uniref:hypothetical protein n=1 Tax=Yersinia TaxID=629 RepID=UPI0005E76A1B|nr:MULTISPECIES: hypothetical protein [Yersinia]EKN3571860.1 hypothetical protein [Yersinia enterocolitica]EKN3597690.1 hypothetical protein [Yersinia enterocolitica]EKN3753868.1 hypothetical protein [Yersinia enterocolitica]EKN3794776.1 hypothetical protein [Yersinia enterocolitica]EKN3828388.1 hypothetical protein [Yersinia enterocolitica]